MLFKKFIDRKSDVVRLGEALKRPDSQFIVVYGRRRIGKSSLIKNVMDLGRDFYFLSDQTSEQNQRVLFSRIVSGSVDGFDKVVYPDWETLFRALNNQLKSRVTVSSMSSPTWSKVVLYCHLSFRSCLISVSSSLILSCVAHHSK